VLRPLKADAAGALPRRPRDLQARSGVDPGGLGVRLVPAAPPIFTPNCAGQFYFVSKSPRADADAADRQATPDDPEVFLGQFFSGR